MQAITAIALVAVVANAASVPQDRLAIDANMAHMVADPIVATFKEHLVLNGCYADASSLIRCTEKVALGEINAA
ncbi:hypothetical protein SARC_10293 [Sphaeroforma arctica JP610]|uniref:UrcA family protein n=1 Tax=Sphaeroforma arctica JP610 TaxID=667725 RepID=A0A0L0FL93_9EUKA|nr:hypothetical protein SARC_10293 [Sphaeroforma arctica JP610]KNC77241.1 hypothetical protein SARC_10293 [Sphaeroforma arctica JP610]|eukprot:XP_014151143.1 hypothetical protein SARC_10293 [Sphaeroforma arctica JP610]